MQIAERGQISLTETRGAWTLQTNLYDKLPQSRCDPVTTDTLGKAIMPEQRFENPDGTPITFDTDYHGEQRTGKTLPGPFAAGAGRIAL